MTNNAKALHYYRYLELPTLVMNLARSLQNQYLQLPTDFYVPKNALQMKSSITKYQIVNHIVQVERCHHELNESHFEYSAIDHLSLTMLSIKAIHKLQEVLS